MAKENLEKIEEIVRDELNIGKEEMILKNRRKDVVGARILFTILARKLGFSLSSIGKYLNRDHTTIINMINVVGKYPYIEMIANKYSDRLLLSNIKLKIDTRYKKYSHIYERFGGKCAVCGFDEVIEIHHIIPKYIGGGDDPNNLIVLCPNHHALVHSGQLKIGDIDKKS
jgi:hypothetical protein